MVQRGRKSQLSLLDAAVTDVVPRPHPPAELTAEESAEWIAICNSVPADYFSQPTHATLAVLPSRRSRPAFGRANSALREK